MAKLEIRYFTGDSETQSLSRDEPVSIGAAASNDVCIDEEDVERIHCRIAWRKNAYEVVSAAMDGVEVNGKLVQHANLNDRDVIRVGSVDLVFLGNSEAEVEDGELKPLSAEEIAREKAERAAADREFEDDDSAPPKLKDSSRQSAVADAIFDDDEFESYEDDNVDDYEAAPATPLRRGGGTAVETAPKTGAAKAAEPAGEAEKGPSVISQVKRNLHTGARRPGERDPVRSPLVLMLAGGALLLALAGATFWFLTIKGAREQLWKAAVEEMEGGRFKQAENRFQEYILTYPTDEKTPEAKVNLNRVKIDQYATGGAPNWPAALGAVEEFIINQRDEPEPEFATLHPIVAEYAYKISLGAANDAGKSNSRDLLQTSQDARVVLTRYGGQGEEFPAREAEIETAFLTSEAAIEKQETFDKAVADIEKTIAAKDSIQAIQLRRMLLERYPDFATAGRGAAKLANLLQQTLDLEQELVTREDVDRDAITDDHPAGVKNFVSLTMHTRARTEEPSQGRLVFGVGKDCLYGVDTITGEPRWRRVIGDRDGADDPFFPLPVSTTVEGLLVFDTNHNELQLLNAADGKLVWRQPFEQRPTGEPYVATDGQLYVATEGNHLFKMAADSGKLSTRLTFSKPVKAPPTPIADGQGFVVGGEQMFVYKLSVRPLACEGVSFTEHKPGSLAVPLMSTGRLVLMCANDGVNSTLRMLDVDGDPKKVNVVDTESITGRIEEPPVLRGPQLFVTSRDERIAAFTVSDRQDQEPLTRLAEFQVQNPEPVPMFLKIGPDGQLWMASTALRKFELSTDAIKADQTEVAVGLAAQPIQMIGERLFTGRKALFADAVVFTQHNRSEMDSGQWRTVLGAGVLARCDGGEGASIIVNELGEIFRVLPRDLDAGGFKKEFTTRVKTLGTTNTLGAIQIGPEEIAVYTGDPEPELSIVNRLGQFDRRVKLDKPLETAPAAVKGGLVLPVSGRLKLSAPRSGSGLVRDYVAPVEQNETPVWKYVVALDDEQVIAVDDRNTLLRIQLRQSPVRHLAPASELKLDHPIDVAPVTHKGNVIFADASGRLAMIDGSSMETRFETQLKPEVRRPLWRVDDLLFVQSGEARLHCFRISDTLEPAWDVPIEGGSVAGPPMMHKGKILVALTDGRVVLLSPDDGSVQATANLGQATDHGPESLGEYVVVPALDGTLYRVDDALQEAKQ